MIAYPAAVRPASLFFVALAACTAAEGTRPPDFVHESHRLTAVDMGLASSARRLTNLTHRLAAAPAELSRLGNLWQARPLVAAELRRGARMPAKAASLAGTDLARQPRLPTGLLRRPADYAHDLAEDLVTTAQLLQGSHHPLAEISDRRHRTSPDDDRPELSWIDRIRRRLRL